MTHGILIGTEPNDEALLVPPPVAVVAAEGVEAEEAHQLAHAHGVPLVTEEQDPRALAGALVGPLRDPAAHEHRVQKKNLHAKKTNCAFSNAKNGCTETLTVRQR